MDPSRSMLLCACACATPQIQVDEVVGSRTHRADGVHLVVGAAVPGAPLLLEVSGLRPGDELTFAGSLSGIGSGPCPPSLGGLCIDVEAPVYVLGTVRADITGHATLSVPLPADLPATTVYVQGVASDGSGTTPAHAVPVIAPGSGVTTSYMVVHLEPGGTPIVPATGEVSFSHPELHWETLLQLVEQADVYGHKLTLMFTPQWSAYVASPECRVPDDGDGTHTYRGRAYDGCDVLLLAMEAHGHEIALHHHKLTAPSTWDGHTDETSWEADRGAGTRTYFADGSGPAGPDPWFLGDVAAMYDAVDALTAMGGDTVTSATTEELPPQIRYTAGGGGSEPYVDETEPGGLVCQPCVEQYGDVWTWDFRMRKFSTIGIQRVVLESELDNALTDHAVVGGDWTMGFVTHAGNVMDTDPANYAALFEMLSLAGIKMQGLESVAGRYEYTATDPALADPSLLCPDYDGE